jgi:Right handed beta helix region
MPRRLSVLTRPALKVPSRRSPKAAISKAMVLALVVASFTVLGSSPALASHVRCGDAITTDTMLDSDLVSCPNNGLVIGADNITLDLNGHTIDGDGKLQEDCGDEEICDTGVVNDSHSGVTVEGGSVRNFAVGVLVRGASSNRLRRLSASRDLFVGLLIVESTATQVEQDSASDNGHTTNGIGIVLFAFHNNRIEGNTVSRNGDQGMFSTGATVVTPPRSCRVVLARPDDHASRRDHARGCEGTLLTSRLHHNDGAATRPGHRRGNR